MKQELKWCSYEDAKQWPPGSVVLCRIPSCTKLVHDNSYYLSLYFKADVPWRTKDAEYLLIETPNKNNEQRTTDSGK